MVSLLAWAGVLTALGMALGGAVRDWWLAERSSRRELELDGWLRRMRREAKRTGGRG